MKQLTIAAEVLFILGSVLYMIMGFITASPIRIALAVFGIVMSCKTISMKMKDES